MFAAAGSTDFDCVAEVDKPKQVSEEPGDHNDEEELSGTSQMTEGSGQFVLPEPRGIEP